MREATKLGKLIGEFEEKDFHSAWVIGCWAIADRLRPCGLRVHVTELEFSISGEFGRTTIPILLPRGVSPGDEIPVTDLLRAIVFVMTGDWPPNHADEGLRQRYALEYASRMVRAPKKTPLLRAN